MLHHVDDEVLVSIGHTIPEYDSSHLAAELNTPIVLRHHIQIGQTPDSLSSLLVLVQLIHVASELCHQKFPLIRAHVDWNKASAIVCVNSFLVQIDSSLPLLKPLGVLKFHHSTEEPHH